MFILTEHQGRIRFQKRFTFSPSCFLTYHLKDMGSDIWIGKDDDKAEIIGKAASGTGLPTPGFMTLLGSFEGYLNVYKDIKLAWTAKLPNQPIFVATAQF